MGALSSWGTEGFDVSTGISYCDETWNPVCGCEPVSEGCRNCWAVRVAHRGMCEQHRGLTHDPNNTGPRWRGDVRLVPDALEKPLRWRKPRVVLTPSMGDMFHEDVPNEYIAAWFGIMAASPAHTFLVLTKRIERALRVIRDYITSRPDNAVTEWMRCTGHTYVTGLKEWGADDPRTARLGGQAPQDPDAPPYPWQNILIGTSVESPRLAYDRLPLVAGLSAAGWRTWLSLEPLLGPVDLEQLHPMGWMRPAVEFVAVGAETGPGARPCDEVWIRSVVEQCKAAGVRCHVKALTGHRSPETWPEDLRVREMPDVR